MVEVVERLGAEILLDLQVGKQSMVASVEPHVRAQRGDKLRFAVRPERLHFFDSTSEAAI
jgi:multiple sugar transport system ATP-binding protein